MEIRKDLAVVDDHYFYARGMRQAHNATSIEELLTWSERLHLTHIWCVPDSHLSLLATQPPPALAGWSSAMAFADAKARSGLLYLSARREEKRYEDRIGLGFVGEWTYATWPWRGVHTPRDLYHTIAFLEQAINQPIEWTAARVGLELIRANHQKRWNWFVPLRTKLEEEPRFRGQFRYENCCPELKFRGELPADARYIVKLDKNSAFPAACTGLMLGSGEPIVAGPGPEALAAYDAHRPGFWWSEIDARESLFDGRRAPGFTGRRWLTTDLIEQLRATGYQITPIVGACWPERHQILRRDMTHLWQLRQQAKKRRQEGVAWECVYESIGAIMHAIPGKFGDLDLRDRHFRRRDWWALIVARATATLLADIEAIRLRTGLLPLLVGSNDALWYATACADPVQALPDTIDREQLGGFKDVYVLRITDEVRDWFADPREKVVKRLNELARQKQVARAKGGCVHD